MKNFTFSQLLGLILVLVCPLTSFAQQNIFPGYVVDSETGTPIEGATVYVPNSAESAITNAQGLFHLPSDPGGDTLIVNYIGYQERRVGGVLSGGVISLQNSPVMIDQVMVSASRDASNRTVQPLAISAVSLKQIQETNASSLYQLLNRTVGVNMVDLGNDQHSLSIRQPNSTRAVYLFLEDGIPIRPTGVFNHNALIEMNLASLRNIEIIRGPSSSIYGSGAIGGAVNFMTHQPSLKPSGRFMAQLDNNGFRNVELRTSNTVGKASYVVSGSFAGRENGFRRYSDYEKYGATAALRFKLNESTFLNTSASLVDYRTDATVSVDSSDFFSRDYGSVHNFAYRIVQALRVQSTLQKSWGNYHQTDLTLFYRDNFIGQNATHTIRNNATNPLAGESQISDLGFTSYGAMLQHKWNLKRPNTRIISGATLDYSPVETENRFITVTRNEEGDYVDFNDPDSLLTSSNIDIVNLAAFAQLEMQLNKQLNLVAGVRYDHFVYNHDNFLDSRAFSGAPDSRDVFSNLTPKIGLNFNPTAQLGLYANYSMGFVPPQVSELYRGVTVPVLGPMEFHNTEVGGWYRLGDVGYFEASLYNLQGSNEIISVLLEDGSTENRNAGNTRHYGVEYSFVLQANKQLTLRFNGTSARHIFREYPERGVDFDGNDMPGAPSLIASLQLEYRPRWSKGLRASLEGFRIGSYYMDAANSEKYPGYYLLHARMGYTWNRYTFHANLLNVTDELYAANATKSGSQKRYSIGDPRSIALGVAIQFGKVDKK